MSPKQHKRSSENGHAASDDKLVNEFEKVWKDKLKAGASKEAVCDEFLRHVRSPDSDLLQQILAIQVSRTRSCWHSKWTWILILPIFITVAIVGIGFTLSTVYDIDPLDLYHEIVHETDCLFENNQMISEISRPVFECHACEGLDEVPVVHDITEGEFLTKYAYSSVPVLIKGATKEWTALNTFSFNYFQRLYRNHSDAFEVTEESCQFFPYKSDFDSLEEAFNMSNSRAAYEEGEQPWYFGWSNCHQEIRQELRHQYTRPKFLPKDSESSNLDWIFMGGPGPGAHIHLDNVQRPSWQAQITGSKTWFLIPPPECEHVCKAQLSVTMTKGDIVIVDTNQWYHSTFIHPGEISITIGSEYD